MIPSTHLAVGAYKWNVFVLDSVADAATAAPLSYTLGKPSVQLSEFNPVDFKNITEAEFVPVRDGILRFVEGATKDSIKLLNLK